jgi:DNA-nicking Smr family endonuclease
MSESSGDDLALFRQAMADVRELRTDRLALRPMPPGPVARQRMADEQQVLRELLTHEIEPEMLETGEELHHVQPGVQRKVLRKLRRGQYGVQRELDLHGYTVALAQQELRDFIAECRRRRIRCVRIIHGKGRRSGNRGPVLKTRVDSWLRRWDEVLAFCSARPDDGGTGAVYVLLRGD